MNIRPIDNVSSAMISPRILLTFAIAACRLAAAEAAWQKELTQPAAGAWPALAPAVVDLEVSWNGMLESGRLRIEFAPADARKPGRLVVRSSATSTGAAAALFPYRNHLWSEIDPSDLRPRFFQAVETDHRETVTTTNRYFRDRVESLETTRPLRGKKAARSSERVFNGGAVFDIFSAMLQVRSRKLEPGECINLVVHPFDNPYLLRVKVVGREMHLGRKAIRLTLGMRKIDRKTLELLPYRKMRRDATLWLSDDDDRIPIELRAAVFIGDVRATLTGFRKT